MKLNNLFEKIQLNELREYLNPLLYGGWINIDGRVENVNSHETWLEKQYDTFQYNRVNDSYIKAFDDGWVRTINDRNSFGVQGNSEIIHRTFKYWWPSASQSKSVYIEEDDKHKNTLYDLPIDKFKLQQDFGLSQKDRVQTESMQLNELREYLNPLLYGGWINIDGRVDNVDSHDQWLVDNYGHFSYIKAFDDGWVRTINDRNGFGVQGNEKSIRKTFKYWWPSAILSNQVHIDAGKDHVSYSMPENKNLLRKEFGSKY